MKKFARSSFLFLPAFMAALLCTACADGSSTAADDSMHNINNNMSYLGVSGSTGESGSSIDMYGQMDTGVSVMHH